MCNKLPQLVQLCDSSKNKAGFWILGFQMSVQREEAGSDSVKGGCRHLKMEVGTLDSAVIHQADVWTT